MIAASMLSQPLLPAFDTLACLFDFPSQLGWGNIYFQMQISTKKPNIYIIKTCVYIEYYLIQPGSSICIVTEAIKIKCKQRIIHTYILKVMETWK